MAREMRNVMIYVEIVKMARKVEKITRLEEA